MNSTSDKKLTCTWFNARFVAVLGLIIACLTSAAIGQNPLPTIVQPLSPTSKAPAGAAFTLTVNGTGFVSGAVVLWNGTARTTTFVSSSKLTAAILSTDIAAATTASVKVLNPAPGGGSSNEAFFEVTKVGTNVSMTRRDITSGVNPQAVAVGDFNGDGKQDLVVVNGNANTVSIFLGNGDGTFQAPTSNFATASGFPLAIATGDFNGDGKLDVAVVVERIGVVSILLGNGDGTLQTHKDAVSGGNPLGLAVGDFNGDGKLDIAVANANDSTASLLLGNGDGTFQNKVDYPTGASPQAVVVGDFNGDGNLDLATANNGDNTVSILLGNGNGTFGSHADSPTAAIPTSLVAADLNGDGKLDVVVSTASRFLSVLLGNGDGSLQTHKDYPVGLNAQWVTAGDFNGDGKLDLVVANTGDNTASILLGNGDGTFKGEGEFPTNSNPGWVVAGDFNGDGRLDLALPAAGANMVSILLQSATSITPTFLNFGGQQAGFTSAPKTVTLKNNNTSALNISTVTIGGPNPTSFVQTNTCGSSVVAGASCTFSLTFTPVSIGPKTSQVVIAFADGSSTGFGMNGTGNVSINLSPRTLLFKTQLLNTTSKAMPVTLGNLSGVPMAINSIMINGINLTSYNQTNNCPPSLPGGQSCTINVTLTPLQTGGLTAGLNVFGAFTAGGGQQATMITGSGTAVSIHPTSLTFAAQTVGTTSAAKVVTFNNVDTTALPITSITISGTNARDFVQTNTCGTSVAAGGTCTISVTFTPAATGTRTATLKIGDTDITGPQQVPLTGTGQ
jgi:VCBS repeat protein/ASPM-SPD-2-Hydin domain-containing protein/FG-GAP repeat protein